MPLPPSKGEAMKGENKEEMNGNLRSKFANVYERFGTSAELEQKGVIIDYKLPNNEIFSICIKRAGARNAEWKKIYNQVMKPHAEDIAEGLLSEIENKVLLAEIWAKSVVVGWDGLKDVEGVAVPFSVETAYELFCFMPDLLSDVISDSHLRSNFQEELVKATAKNS